MGEPGVECKQEGEECVALPQNWSSLLLVQASQSNGGQWCGDHFRHLIFGEPTLGPIAFRR